jgi:hypothetical protein
MKNPIRFAVVITVVVILAGCGATSKEIARMSQSERTGVFPQKA